MVLLADERAGAMYGSKMQFRVLGPIEVDAGSGPIPLGGSKQRKVLANLLVRANTVVPADRLITEIWGEGDQPDGARHTLQTYVSNLRRSLGEDRLIGRPPGYVLNLEPLDLDAAQFDSLVRDASHLLPVDPQVAVSTLDDALRLWRGPALADVADTTTLLAEAARLDELRLDAQEKRIEGLLATGLAGSAVGELEKLIADHPLRERLWGLLMVALYRDGRQSDALNAYQRERKVLTLELGIDPSPEHQLLQEKILRHDPSLSLRGQGLRGYRLLEKIEEGPTGTVFRAIQPHVGRDVALKLFHEELASDPAFVRHFEPQAQAIANLEHPHLVPVYDYWREPSRACLVSRFLRGGNLLSLWLRDDGIGLSRGLRIVEHISSALAFVHRQSMAHGDVSPSNVLLDLEGNAYIGGLLLGAAGSAKQREDVVALGRLTAELLGTDIPPTLATLVDRATRERVVPEAAEFAVAAQGALDPKPRRNLRRDVRNPFKGLRAFMETEERDFFGRSSLTTRLLNRLARPAPEARFLALVGPSGCGKSSLARAALLPAIRRGDVPALDDPVVTEMSPGQHPMDELANALFSVAVRPVPQLERLLQSGSRGLLEAVDAVAPADSPVVLLVDQFEELFTLTESDRERELFLESLRVALVEPRSRLHVIATLRADFYDRPLLYPRFGEMLAISTEAIAPLTPDELEQAIRAPCEHEGIAVEPPLVAELIADAANSRGALPLFQFVLTELFEGREEGSLTSEKYREIGGIVGALTRQAEHCYESSDSEGQRAIRQVFLRLVTLGEGTSDTRRRVPVPALADLEALPDAVERALDTYGKCRLLSFDREPSTREPTVEIAHEALLTRWSRLRSWIDEARDDLREERRLIGTANDWVSSGRDASYLLRGTRLSQVEAWTHSSILGVRRDVLAYIKASLDDRDSEEQADRERRLHEARTEQRARTRLRALVAVFAAAAIVAGVLTLVATGQSSRAEAAARAAEARELAAASVASLDDDPETGILLAVQAVELTRSVDGTVLPEAEEALHRAVTASRVSMTVPAIGGRVAWSSDGVFVASDAATPGMVELRDAKTGESVTAPFIGHEGRITDVAFNRDGTMLATAGTGGQLKVWNPTNAGLISHFGGRGPVSAVSFSNKHSLVSAVWNERSMRVINPTTREEVLHLHPPVHDPPLSPNRRLQDAALSPNGQLVALASSKRVRIFDISENRRVLSLNAVLVNALSWSPDGGSLATVGSNGVIEVWDTQTGRVRNRMHGQRSYLWAVAWSPDSSRIVTGGSQGAAQVWQIGKAEGREIYSLSSHEMASGIRGVTFSPDGDEVMAGAMDSTALKVWDVSAKGDAELANLPAPSSFGDVELSPDGNTAFVTTRRHSVNVWNLDDAQMVLRIGRSVHGHPPEAWDPRIEVSPDGRLIAVTGGTAGLSVYDTSTGEDLFDLRHARRATDWNQDGSLLAAELRHGTIAVLDRSGDNVATLHTDDAVADLTFGSDDDLITTYARTRNDTETAGRLTTWDRTTDSPVRSMNVDGGIPAFDSTGTHFGVATGNLVEIVDLSSGIRRDVSLQQSSGVWAMEFSPDGSTFAVAGPDAIVRTFDTQSGAAGTLLRGHEIVVSALSFSDDGTALASLDPIQQVRVWAMDVNDLLSVARDEITRPMTDAECLEYLRLEQCAVGDGPQVN